DDGADGDPDHDGRTNAQELADGTHPRGMYSSYFARGRADQNGRTRIALFNPSDSPARVLVRLIPDTGRPVAEYRLIAPSARGIVETTALESPLDGGFAVIIESDRPIVAERTITQVAPTATDGEMASKELSTTWYVAGGSTREGRTTRYAV